MAVLVLTFAVVGIAAGLVALDGPDEGPAPAVWQLVRVGVGRQIRLWDRYLWSLYPWDERSRSVDP
jgi:hypothetical protein